MPQRAPSKPRGSKPVTATVTAHQPRKKKTSVTGVLLLLLPVAAVLGGVGWLLHNLAQDELEAAPMPPESTQRVEKRSPVAAPVEKSPDEAEEPTSLGKRKPKPKALAVLPTNLTPVERAWRAVKGDYDTLEGRNETTAKKYRLKIIALEDKKSGDATAFIKEAQDLRTAIEAELARPENQ